MPSKAQPIRIGPFTGGMNSAADPTAVEDTELVDSVNFELDIEGSLVCRPAIVEIAETDTLSSERLVFIGKATLAGGNYVFASNSDGTWAYDGNIWTLVKADLTSRVALQYQDLVFFVAITGSVADGGYWDGSTWTTDASMPRGESAVFYKSRMFVVPGLTATGAAAHQLRYTDPISISAPTPLVWTATNLIPVSQGDGEKLVEIVVYQDNLVLFKQDSTYVLAYDIRISDAILREINSVIGASDRHCVISYENSVYVLHEGRVYQLDNYNFKHLNLKVPFIVDASDLDQTEDVSLNKLGDRLVVRYYDNTYVFNLKTETWSRWESASPLLHRFGPIVEFPVVSSTSNLKQFYAGSSSLTGVSLLRILDGFTNEAERTTVANFDITCSFLTKTFNGENSHHFKKLMWWGADIISNRDVMGIATPIVNNFAVRWEELNTVLWADMNAFTWGQPKQSLATVDTDVTDLYALNRKFIKFRKTLRWRQINFRVTLISNGTLTDGPCKVFGLTAMVLAKQTVVKQVS